MSDFTTVKTSKKCPNGKHLISIDKGCGKKVKLVLLYNII
jgi:hypothetical protein